MRSSLQRPLKLLVDVVRLEVYNQNSVTRIICAYLILLVLVTKQTNHRMTTFHITFIKNIFLFVYLVFY